MDKILCTPAVCAHYMRLMLFGSRSDGGNPRIDSDIDIAILLDDSTSKTQAAETLKRRLPNSTVDVFPDYGPNHHPLHFLVMNDEDLYCPNHPLSASVRAGVFIGL